jgi:5-hydroxyisourate hydrolase-like protein (transthyretin family)
MRTTQGQVVAALALGLALGLSMAPRLLGAARAQPVIRVEAQTRLELSTTRTDRATRVRALLLDDQGRPVAGAPISIRIAGASGQPLAERPRVLTGSDGAFEIALPAVDERISVDARFAGDDFRSPTSALELLDTRLALVELRFSEPSGGVIDLQQEVVNARVRARSEAGGEGVRIELSDDKGVALGTAVTDAEGVVQLAIATKALREPGPGKLIATALPDATRAGASAELSIVRWLPSRTSLTLKQAGRNAVRASGEVRANERGLPGAMVGLFTPRGDHVATLSADPTGRFEGKLDPKTLGERNARSIELEARFESDAPWIGSSRSGRVQLGLAAPSGYSVYWLALTPAAIALLLWWLGRRRSALELEPPAKERAEAGVALAQARPRAVRLHHLACIVLDARTGRPVADATLTIELAGAASRSMRSDARGAIRSDELAPGSYQLVFEAAGYRALRVSVDAPHRGEWIGAHVRLESLRDVAVRAWSPLALQLASKPDQAHAITVREAILRSAQRSTAQPSFASEALERTERAAYERTAPTDDDVQRVEDDASALLRSNAEPRE